MAETRSPSDRYNEALRGRGTTKESDEKREGKQVERIESGAGEERREKTGGKEKGSTVTGTPRVIELPGRTAAWRR